MANVYIEEFPIQKNIISTKYYSSILYIDNEYYVVQFDKIYKLDFITGEFSVVATLKRKAIGNAIFYNRKIYYYCKNGYIKGFRINAYDIDTKTESYFDVLPLSKNNVEKDVYSSDSFCSLSLKNNILLLTTNGAYYGDYNEPFNIITVNLDTNEQTVITSKVIHNTESWTLISPTKFVNDFVFDHGSVGTGYGSPSFGGGKRLYNEIIDNNNNRGNYPYVSYHSMIKEYDGYYLIDGGYYGAEYGGIFYFKEYSSEPKKVLDLDATYINGYVDQISEGQYVLLGTEKVAIIHIEPYKNTYTIKNEKGIETYAELNQAPNMNKALLSVIGNEKALKLTGINTENYSIKWTSFTPADKVFLGLSVAPNSSAPLIPVGKEVPVSFNDSTVLYEVYGKYKPLSTRFEIHTYKSSAEQNRVDKTNFLTADMIISGVLREASSLIHPSITFTSDIIPTFNYVYIPIFNRYYYVTDITSIKNKLWQMSLTVDVLMTYKEALLACTGYIDRNENEYNGLIPDNMISLEKGETIETVALNNELFISTRGSYVIQGLLIGAGNEVTPTDGSHTGSSGDEHDGGGGNF